MHLSFDQSAGHYKVDESIYGISQMNAKNAILLNCRDPRLFEKIY